MNVSLSKMFAGRRRESLVWDYFDYCEQTRKSKCRVVDKSGKECGALLADKNSSNLVNHLSRLHKETYTEFDEKEKAREHVKQDVKRTSTAQSSAPPMKTQSLEQCLQRKIETWPTNSTEQASTYSALQM